METQKITSKKMMTRRTFLGTSAAVAASFAAAGLFGCSSGSNTSASSQTASTASFDLNDWDSVLEAAKGQTVNVNMMTGSQMAAWMNDECAKAVEQYGIKWNLTVAANTVDVANLVSSEIGGGNTENGSVDLMWVNGENFFSLKNAGYLYGPILTALPAYEFCDPDDLNVTVDCGVETDGYEVPFQAVWDVFWANTDVIPESDFPTNTDELMTFVKKYPGLFTYAEPGNYKGTYFVDTVIAGVCGRDVWSKINQEALTKDEMKELIQPALDYLVEMNPYLWNKGASFPADGDQVQQLFADGEIACLFETTMPQSAMDEGTVSEKTRPFFLKSGLIHDFWYMAIPDNASNKAAALVTANELMQPYMQIAQFNAVGYYPFTPYDLMDEKGKAAYDKIEWTEGLVEPTEMQDYYIPQANGANNDLIEELWLEEVNGK